MKSIKNIFYILLAAISLQSCKEEVDLDVPNGEPKVVVESEITTETDSSFVKITKTSNYYSTDPYPTITDATVTVNGVPFLHTGKGIYRPAVPYTGIRGQIYNLNIVAEGKTYTSSAILERMFRVDSVFQIYKDKEAFQDAGYTINFVGFDDRPRTKYTYFRQGKFDTIVQRDSIEDFKVLFNSTETKVGESYNFELPFTRLQKGEECIMIFRSVTKEMSDFIAAYSLQTDGAPGPFQVPPANLPTNVTGGAIGYFATYDVVRKRYTVK
jgi:hypothetical protein